MNPVIRELLNVHDASQRAARLRGDRRFVTDLEERSGYERTIWNRWRHQICGANITTVCDVANALGYRVVLEKIEPGRVA